jgi:hypothetical protein
VAVIDRYCAVGELFGTLVQYSDDVLDQATQLEDTATLPAALRAAAHAQGTQAGAAHGQAFWAYLYLSYLAALAELNGDAVATLLGRCTPAKLIQTGQWQGAMFFTAPAARARARSQSSLVTCLVHPQGRSGRHPGCRTARAPRA